MPFSSAAAVRPSSDDELLRVINSEIKFAEDCDDQDRVAFRPRPTLLPIPITCSASVTSFQRELVRSSVGWV
jgi:hypothetical protein